MNDKVASSKALGFGIFAIPFWLVSMGGAGFAPQAYGGSPPHVVIYMTAVGLLIAAIAAFLRHETWLAFFFMLWSAVSWGTAGLSSSANALPMATMGWFWFAIAFVNLYLWLAVLRKCELGRAVPLTVLLATLTLIGAGLNGVLGIWLAGRIGAYIGLATALVAFYVSAEAIMNKTGGGWKLKSGGGTDNPPVI